MGLIEPLELSQPVTVSVPDSRHPRHRRGLVVRRRANVDSLHGCLPPRTTLIQTLLDLVTDTRDPADVVHTVIRCMDRGRISPQHIRSVWATVPSSGHERWSSTWSAHSNPEFALLSNTDTAATSNTRTRCHSPLDSRVGVVSNGWYVRDLDYRPWRLVVELDGRLNHASTDRVFWDMDRDNASVLSGEVTLRFGWLAVAGAPCRVAAQVSEVLKLRGWQGQPQRCGAACQLPS